MTGPSPIVYALLTVPLQDKQSRPGSASWRTFERARAAKRPAMRVLLIK